jgi:hypothetical protein
MKLMYVACRFDRASSSHDQFDVEGMHLMFFADEVYAMKLTYDSIHCNAMTSIDEQHRPQASQSA